MPKVKNRPDFSRIEECLAAGKAQAAHVLLEAIADDVEIRADQQQFDQLMERAIEGLTAPAEDVLSEHEAPPAPGAGTGDPKLDQAMSAVAQVDPFVEAGEQAAAPAPVAQDPPVMAVSLGQILAQVRQLDAVVGDLRDSLAARTAEIAELRIEDEALGRKTRWLRDNCALKREGTTANPNPPRQSQPNTQKQNGQLRPSPVKTVPVLTDVPYGDVVCEHHGQTVANGFGQCSVCFSLEQRRAKEAQQGRATEPAW